MSEPPAHSPAILAGLTVYPPASRTGVFSPGVRPNGPCRARAGDVEKAKTPMRSLTGVFVLATSYSRAAYRRTTIGAAAFHFRVRNGNGWGHCATITRVRNRTGGFAAVAATQARGRTLETTLTVQRTRFQTFKHLKSNFHLVL